MSDGEVTGIAHRFDLPSDARGAFAQECFAGFRVAHFEAAAGGPVRVDGIPELVFAADIAVRDGFPEPLRRGPDVDFEDLFHGTFQPGFEVAEGSGPWFCIFADPAVVDQPDGHRIHEVEFLPTPTAGHHQAGILQLLEVLHDAVAGHVEVRLKCVQGFWPHIMARGAACGGIAAPPSTLDSSAMDSVWAAHQ